MAEIISMNSFVFRLQDIDKTKINIAGGKAANLGELTRIESIRVPDGFCISTEAFKKIVGETSPIKALLEQLLLLTLKDKDKISELSAEIRKAIEEVTIPQDIQKEINSFSDDKNAYTVRS